MLIEKIPKEELPPGQHKSHNLDKTVVTMTRDHAVLLICQLAKALGTPGRFNLSSDPFPEGLWGERDISFCVVDEPTFIEYRQGLRDAKEKL
jgi:hypothetical protein